MKKEVEPYNKQILNNWFIRIRKDVSVCIDAHTEERFISTVETTISTGKLCIVFTNFKRPIECYGFKHYILEFYVYYKDKLKK